MIKCASNLSTFPLFSYFCAPDLFCWRILMNYLFCKPQRKLVSQFCLGALSQKQQRQREGSDNTDVMFETIGKHLLEKSKLFALMSDTSLSTKSSSSSEAHCHPNTLARCRCSYCNVRLTFDRNQTDTSTWCLKRLSLFLILFPVFLLRIRASG